MAPFFLIFIFIVLVPQFHGEAQAQEATDLPVTEYQLENGMRFLILEKSQSPTVSFVLQYRVGGIDDKTGSTGTAHLLEHLLFKGTRTIGTLDLERETSLLNQMDLLEDSIIALEETSPTSPAITALKGDILQIERQAQIYVVANEFEAILTRNGARGLNASTDSESTKYYLELPSNRAKLWFMLESERMTQPVFREFYTERDVVAEERRSRIETQPGNLLYEAHLKAAFKVHPYREPVVGHMQDINNLSRRDIQSHYKKHYGPENAVVAVVGNSKAELIQEWADQYFGHLPRGGTERSITHTEPDQKKERRVSVVFEGEPQLRIGWHTVPTDHPDNPALMILTALLTGNRSGRLFQRLVVQDQIASNVTSSIGPGDLFPRLFSINVSIPSPVKTEDVEQSVYEELENLAEIPPSEEDLQRIRNQISAGQIRGLASNFGLALQLAHSTTLYGNWKYTFELSQKLKDVQPEMISLVIKKYFNPSNRTVATLVPIDSCVR